MEQDKFVYFCDCFEAAFQKMVSPVTELEFTRSEESWDLEGKKLSTVVGVVGLNKGRIHIEMNDGLARKLYDVLNGEPVEDEMDLCFYLAEFTNMITGNGITVLNSTYKGSNLRLTPPAIFTSDNINVTTPKEQAESRLYNTKYGAVRIEIGFDGV